jgi:site-specific recombinase XerC
MALLEAYAADRGVAPSTLLRWKPVMATLDTQPWQRPDWDAQDWIDSLVTEGRSKGTVQRTWLAACKTLMRWALKRKRIATNPFTDVVMSVPKKVITRETGRGFRDTEAKTILSAALQVPLLPIGSNGSERSSEYALGGKVAIYYAPSGLMWQLTCPAANALEPEKPERN